MNIKGVDRFTTSGVAERGLRPAATDRFRCKKQGVDVFRPVMAALGGDCVVGRLPAVGTGSFILVCGVNTDLTLVKRGVRRGVDVG